MRKYIIIGLFISAIVATATATTRRPITTCQWPNTCGSLHFKPITRVKSVAQFKPCVWPNPCAVAM